MTVDVEDYFQVSAFEPYIRRDQWGNYPHRVVNNTETVLKLFADHGIKATFFVLGWVAEHYPALIRRIVAEGHELASHGYNHTRVYQQTQEQFFQDIDRTKKLLEDLGGQYVQGYRAATYSIRMDNLWALEQLQKAGYRYSSSIYPVVHDLYGIPDAPRFPFSVRQWLEKINYPQTMTDTPFLEIPVTTMQWRHKRLPCGGGGYFRLLPYFLYRRMLATVNHQDNQSGIFYFHPWEIDPNQPRIPHINAKTRFRHYLNLGRMEKRLARLLQDFSWDRMDNIFL